MKSKKKSKAKARRSGAAKPRSSAKARRRTQSAGRAKPKTAPKAAAKRAARPKAKILRLPRAAAVSGAQGRAGSRPSGGRSSIARAASAGPAGPKTGRAAKPTGSREPGYLQGTFEFEAEPPETALTLDSHLPLPPPATTRRRGSPKVNSPDYPGESLTVGMPAPEFTLPSSLGRPVSLNEFRGKRVVLYFYPKDDTPGCTMEACAFRDAHPRIESKDAVVLGISLDDELSHERFTHKYNLNFPLLSDKDAVVSRQYGTYKQKNLYGRNLWGIERTTFVIDREGKVEHVFRRVKVEGHAEEVMATLAG